MQNYNEILRHREATMKDSRKREIRIKAEAFREKCKVSRYGIIDLFKE